MSDINQDIQKIADKLHIDLDWARGIRPEDILWLLDHCPFLQIVNPHVSLDEGSAGPEIVQAQTSGWDVHVYPDAMSSSPGRFLFGGGDFRILSDDDEGGGGRIINPGKGTIYNQTIVTGMDMVNLAVARGWKAIQVVDGHPRMIRGAWLEAQRLRLPFSGYTPSEDDMRVLERFLQTPEEFEAIRRQVQKLKP